MVKKNYQKPSMKVVQLQHRSQLLTGSDRSVRSTSSNLTGNDAIEYGGSDETYDGYVR